MALLRVEHTNWVPSAKWSALETYIKVALYRRNRLHLGLLYMAIQNAHMPAITIDGKKAVNLKACREG